MGPMAIQLATAATIAKEQSFTEEPESYWRVEEQENEREREARSN